MVVTIFTALMLVAAVPAATFVTPTTWREVEVVDGIHVWAADGPGGFWGRARGRVQAPAESLFRRLSDFESLPHLYPWLVDVRVLERSAESSLVYFRYDLPWPISDRDYVAIHRWRTEPSGTIIFGAEGEGVSASHDDDTVSVEGLIVQMTFAPIEDGIATDVEYLFRADLGGMLPRSVRAATAWKVPMNAILSMRRSLEPRYAHRNTSGASLGDTWIDSSNTPR
jgi:hypothetical protein